MSNITLGTIEQRRAEVADMRRRLRIFNSIDMSKRGKELEMEYELWEIGQVGYWFCWFFVFVSWGMVSYAHNEELVRWGHDFQNLHDCNTTSTRGMYNDIPECLSENERFRLNIMQLFGKLIGAFIAGMLADVFGRLLIFRILLAFHTVLSIILIITTSPGNGYFCRFMIVLTSKGMAIICFVLLIDYCSRQTRCVCGLLFHSFKGFGFIILGWIMINCANWRYRETIWLCATQSFLLFSAYFLPESARLYNSYGQTQHAWRTVRNINKLGQRIDIEVNDVEKSFKKQLSKCWQTSGETFRSSEFYVRLILFSIPGFLMNDLLLKANEEEIRNKICKEYSVFVILMGVIEVITYVISIPLFATLGRKFTIIMLHLLACVLYIIVFVLEHSLTRIIFMILARLVVKSARGGTLVMAAETFPTNCRGTAIGVIVLLDEFGTLLYRLLDSEFCFSQIGVLTVGGGLIFIFNIISAFIILLVPPTRRRILVNTYSEAYDLVKKTNEHVGLRSALHCFK